MEWGVLCATALLTSTLSAVVGMAGGATLLAVMLIFYEPLWAIPLHGVVQGVSNGSRTWMQARHVQTGIVLRYAAGLLPAGLLGYRVLQELPAEASRAAVALFVLVATWAPGALRLGLHPERQDPHRRFWLLGSLAGFLNTTLGAVGPVIAPFFLNLGLDRFQLIGTKAACQLLGHGAKLLIFGLAGFAFAEHVPLLSVLCALTVAGTWLGTRILDRVDEETFVLLYKGVLSAVALHLLARAALGLRAGA